MTRRLVAWLLLLAVFVSASPWELAAASPPADPQMVAGHSAPGEPSPEPTPAGDPCEGNCLCPNCPAHSLAPPEANVAIGAVIPIDRVDLAAGVGELHPRDFIDRVFHPPRLG